MPISALIADDEASARSRLRKVLAPYAFDLIEGDAHDGLAALEAIQKHRPQVVFLDVEMPGLDGFGVVQALSPENMPFIVFVTAYDQHALAAFEANAVAYLLKPVVEDRPSEDSMLSFRPVAIVIFVSASVAVSAPATQPAGPGVTASPP